MPTCDLVLLLPCHGLEDFPTSATGPDATSLLVAWTTLWHPRLIAATGRTPRWVAANEPPLADPSLRAVVPLSARSWLASGWSDSLRQAGGELFWVDEDRAALLDRLLRSCQVPLQEPDSTDPQFATAADFLALGYAYLQVELLTRQMRHGSSLDLHSFRQHVVSAAESWSREPADLSASTQSLQNAFDLLAQQRDHYYPVDVFVLDVNLVEPSTSEGLQQQLLAPTAQSLLLTGATLKYLGERDSVLIERLRERTAEKRVGIVTAGQQGMSLPILPPAVAQWDYARGLATFEQQLDYRPQIYGRRSAGWSTLVPKLVHGFSGRGIWLTALDGSQVPTASQTKTTWEGIGGASVQTFARPPLDARQDDVFLRWSVELSESMDTDHVAARALVHWPGQTSPFYTDLQRVARWSKVLGRWVTWEEFFYESADTGNWDFFNADEFRSDPAAELIGGGGTGPISQCVRLWDAWSELYELRSFAAQAALLDQLQPEDYRLVADTAAWLDARWNPVAAEHELSGQRPPSTDPATLEPLAASPPQQQRPDSNDLQRVRYRLWQAICHVVGQKTPDESQLAASDASPGSSPSSPTSPAACLLNPWAWPQRSFHTFPTSSPQEPDASSAPEELTGETTVYLSHQHESRIESLLDTPGSGFAICHRGTARQLPASDSADEPLLLGDSLTLRNEFLEAHMDPKTGGINQLFDFRSRGNLVSQQLAVRSAGNPQPGKQTSQYSVMRADSCDWIANSPARAAVQSRGVLVNPADEVLCRYEQTVTLQRGSRWLDFRVRLEPVTTLTGGLWENYACARFAWRDESAVLSRNVHLAKQETQQARIEAPLFIEIQQEPSPVTLLTAGLPYHQRTGPRHLDTLLVVDGEPQREFRFGVAVGLSYPLRDALSWHRAPAWIALDAAPACQRGWLFHIDAKNTVVGDWEVLWQDHRPIGVRLHVHETEGRYAAAHISAARPCQLARRVTLSGELERMLTLQNDAVQVDLAPLDWAVVELYWQAPGEKG